MKIAFIGQKGIPAIAGGVEKHVEKLASALVRLGHEVTVYTRPHYTNPALSTYLGVRLISLPSFHTKHGDALSHTFLATLHALFQGYDVIHYQSIGPSVLSVLPRLLLSRTKVVATFHSRDYFHQKWGWFARAFLRWAEVATLFFPQTTIAASDTIADYVRMRYGRSLPTIRNGADGEPTNETRFLKTVGLKEGRYVLVVSRFVRHKGIHYVIKAFQGLQATAALPGNGWKLAIVGAATKDTADYETYLRFLAEGNNDILFLGERVGEEIRELYSHAAVFVQPSEDEGLSLALLEAMAHGAAPLVSDIPANREGIGEAGLLFANKDIADLKMKLRLLVNSPAEGLRLGQSARERIARHFDWNVIAKKTVGLYNTLDVAAKEHVQSSYVAAQHR